MHTANAQDHRTPHYRLCGKLRAQRDTTHRHVMPEALVRGFSPRCARSARRCAHLHRRHRRGRRSNCKYGMSPSRTCRLCSAALQGGKTEKWHDWLGAALLAPAEGVGGRGVGGRGVDRGIQRSSWRVVFASRIRNLQHRRSAALVGGVGAKFGVELLTWVVKV